jgi:site-specific DNA-adenine methylase
MHKKISKNNTYATQPQHVLHNFYNTIKAHTKHIQRTYKHYKNNKQKTKNIYTTYKKQYTTQLKTKWHTKTTKSL